MENQDKQTVNLDGQTAQTNEQTVQSSSNTDWKTLHENEVDYNKKLRGKNQELESRLEQYEKDKAASRQKKMEEAGEFKTILAEKEQAIESLTKKAVEYDSYLQSRKNKLLETFTESDRESFSHLPLQDIEKLSQRFNTQAQNVTNVPEGKSQAGTGEFGGYSSPVEWAQKDPAGYQKSRTVAGSGVKIAYDGNAKR